MGRTKQTARKETSGRQATSQVAYSVWQSDQNAAKSSGQAPPAVAPPKAVKYDVSYESSFFNHYFETGTEKVKAFAPTYQLANTVEPYAFPYATPPTTEGQLQHWLHFYFNSKFDGHGAKVDRPNLHLVIALDVSGSMSMNFAGEVGKTKIQVAQESLLTLLRQLRPEDSFGLIIFNSSPTMIQELKPWKNIDQVDLEKQIMKLRATGGTDISSAVNMATGMYTNAETEREGYSNRIFYLTDMEVTVDDGNKFKESVGVNSNRSLYSTVVGIGLDLTQDVIKTVSKTAGCNYCNVRSNATFTTLMDQEFTSIVTPIAFNIKLSMVSNRYQIAAGFGSPEVSDIKAGDSALFSTEFPSVKNQKGETRSGVILFRVHDAQPDKPHEPFQMKVTWDDLSGVSHKDEQQLNFAEIRSPYTTTSTGENAKLDSEFASSGIRKAVMLVRYTDFFKKYIDLRGADSSADKIEMFQNMRRLYPTVVRHFRSEMEILGDPSLQEELTYLTEIAEIDDIPIDKPNQTPSSVNNNNNNNNNNNAPQVTNDGSKAAQNDERPDDTLCCVCLAEEKSVTLLPCNHKCICKKCIHHLVPTCPLCRAPVTGTTGS
eukprot:Phypoly_transcript_05201.p1 GENE.Phypoly_transcript_05201~~Phypoly_transcript_05201.p1  ORF type:complete len:600 (+),score=119.37 Phypoly_transcript_05201:70-1869(+)